MSRAAYCTVCEANVYVGEGDTCPNGHGPECLTGFYEAPTPPPPPPPAATTSEHLPVQKAKSPLLLTIGAVALLAILLLGGALGLQWFRSRPRPQAPEILLERLPGVMREATATVSGSIVPSTASAAFSVNGGTWQAVNVNGGRFEQTIALDMGENVCQIRVKVSESGETTIAKFSLTYRPFCPLSVQSPADGFHTTKTAVSVKGSTTPGARVTVGGKAVSVASDGSFQTQFPLSLGENRLTVVAASDGYDESRVSLVANRNETAAAYKRSCGRIAYKYLSKNPDKYTTDRFQFFGQIAFIRESSGVTEIQLNITPDGWGYWSDEVYVTYNGSTSFVQGDLIQVWGDCTGSYEYKSIAGWDMSVPGLTARYVAPY